MVLELATNVDTDDVWMPERGGKVSLALESHTELVALLQIYMQHLQRVLPRQRRVLNKVGLAHASWSKLA